VGAFKKSPQKSNLNPEPLSLLDRRLKIDTETYSCNNSHGKPESFASTDGNTWAATKPHAQEQLGGS
jgi:hypothetical protein